MITVIDGRIAGPDATLPMLARNGHFTAMQVRGRRARGLELHLARLQAANRELYDAELDTGSVLDSIRTALGDDIDDASVRVHVLEADRLHLFVTVRPPQEAASSPRTVTSVVHQRFLPHIKHTGGFAQGYYGARAQARGFDEALFTTAEGLVSEGTITNVGCFDGAAVIWPDAPMLHGITMQVMERRLRAAGIPQERRPVAIGDLPSFESVFLTSSHGVVMVGGLEDAPLPLDGAFAARLLGLYADEPWETI